MNSIFYYSKTKKKEGLLDRTIAAETRQKAISLKIIHFLRWLPIQNTDSTKTAFPNISFLRRRKHACQ